MLHDVLHRFRSLFRRSAVEAELDEELQYHFDRHVERGLRAGLTPQEARRQARLAIGTFDAVKEEHRDARGTTLAESLIADVKYSLRQIGKNPGFGIVSILLLAIGIGASATIFTLMDAIYWRWLPVREPQGLFLLGTRFADGSLRGFTYRDYRLLAANDSAFRGIAAYAKTTISVSVEGSVEPASDCQLVTGDYFSLLGVQPILGRPLSREDDQAPNSHPVALISHGYWRNRFASGPNIVGRRIFLSGTPFTIVGVTPSGFFGIEVGRAPDFFAPLMMQPALQPSTENLLARPSNLFGWLRPIVRLKDGLSPAAIEPVLDRHFKSERISDSKEPPPDRWRLVLAPAANGASDLRTQFSQPLTVLLGMVGLLLLMTCTTVASMLVARTAARAPEFALRLVLGATQRRLVRQVLTECLTLTLAGGLLGLWVAPFAAGALVTMMSTGRSKIALNLEPDWVVLSAAAGVAVLCAVFCSLVPLLRLRGKDAGTERTSTAEKSSLRTGRALLVVEVALSVVLLMAAALFVRNLRNLAGRDEGFDRRSILTVRVEPVSSDQRNGSRGAVAARLHNTYLGLLRDVSSLPGVRSASLAHYSPTSTVHFSESVKFETGREMVVPRLMIYPDYFGTMGISMLAGRDFSVADVDPGAPYTVVVNESFARQAFGQTNAVGQSFFTSAGRNGTVRAEIIGVAANSKYANLRGDAPAVIYQPFLQTSTGRGQMILHVRVEPGTTAVSRSLRETVANLDRSLPVFDIRTLADEVDAALVRERMIATLATFFGGTALMLVGIGVYGLFSFAAARRTREIGIRMALGATKGDVIGTLMFEVGALLTVGLVLGVAAAVALGLALASQISGLLFGLSVTDPVSIAAAAAIMLLVAGAGGFLPAWKAARGDPSAALRLE